MIIPSYDHLTRMEFAIVTMFLKLWADRVSLPNHCFFCHGALLLWEGKLSQERMLSW